MLQKFIHNISVLNIYLLAVKALETKVLYFLAAPQASKSLQQRYCTMNISLSRQQNPTRLLTDHARD
jgi:hypothetical protein